MMRRLVRFARMVVRWGNRNLATLALVLACTAMAAGFWVNTNTLRASCEDRNRRDARFLDGLEQLAVELGGSTHTIDTLRPALEPRDCEALYPRWPV